MSRQITLTGPLQDYIRALGMHEDATDQTADTVAIRALNRRIHEDNRVDATLLPIGDGLTLALKL